MEIITRVDEYFLRAKVPVPYPSVVIESKNIEALPILVEALEPGNISIIFEYDGKYNVIKKKISASALTLTKLLEVYKFTITPKMLTREYQYASQLIFWRQEHGRPNNYYSSVHIMFEERSRSSTCRGRSTCT